MLYDHTNDFHLDADAAFTTLPCAVTCDIHDIALSGESMFVVMLPSPKDCLDMGRDRESDCPVKDVSFDD